MGMNDLGAGRQRPFKSSKVGYFRGLTNAE